MGTDFEKFEINEDDYCMALTFLALERSKDKDVITGGYEVSKAGLEWIKSEGIRKGYPVPSAKRLAECVSVIQKSLT